MTTYPPTRAIYYVPAVCVGIMFSGFYFTPSDPFLFAPFVVILGFMISFGFFWSAQTVTISSVDQTIHIKTLMFTEETTIAWCAVSSVVRARGRKRNGIDIIRTNGETISIPISGVENGEQLFEHLQRVVHEQKISDSEPDASAPQKIDMVAELERLDDLRKKGILTEEEFTIKKRVILGDKS